MWFQEVQGLGDFLWIFVFFWKFLVFTLSIYNLSQCNKGIKRKKKRDLEVPLFFFFNFFFNFYLFMIVTQRERERGAETLAEGEAGSMHREPDVGFDPGSPGSRPGPKAGAKPLRHPGIPWSPIVNGHSSTFLGTPQLSILHDLCSPRDLALQAAPDIWVVIPIQRGPELARVMEEEERGTALWIRGKDESWMEEIW